MSSASTSSSQPVAEAAAVPVAETPPFVDGFRQLPERGLPSPAEQWLLHGRPIEGQTAVLMHQTAMLQVAAHSESNLSVELGGALLGQAYRHHGGVIIEVKAALPAISEDNGPVHFTFSADSWSRLHKDKAQHYPDLDIIGWFHTHPDLGVFYSSDDVVVHSAAFTQPWHVGLVVDPVRQEAATFGWTATGLAAMPGFYELPERQPQPIVPWRAVPTAVWNQPYEPTYEAASSGVYLPARRGGNAISGRELGLGAAALGLLSLLLLLAAIVIPMWQRSNLLEGAVLALADQQQASAGSTCPDPQLRIIAPFTGSAVTGDAPLVGTAIVPDARRYQIDMRPLGGETWNLVAQIARDVELGELARWNTAALPEGPYELRLSAVDHNNIRLANSNPCIVIVTVAH